MQVTTLCPQCNARFNVRGEFLGRTARCKKCGTRFTLAGAAVGRDEIDPRKSPPQAEDPTASTARPVGAAPIRRNLAAIWMFAGLAAIAVFVLGGVTWWSLATRAAGERGVQAGRTELIRLVSESVGRSKTLANSHAFDDAAWVINEAHRIVDESRFTDAATYETLMREVEDARRHISDLQNEYQREMHVGRERSDGKAIGPPGRRRQAWTALVIGARVGTAKRTEKSYSA